MTSQLLDAPAGGHDLPDVTRHFASASADMLGAILDQSLDCIKLIGPTGQLDFMNRNGRCAMEIDDFAAIAGRDWWEMWPSESQPLVRDAVDRAQAGLSSRFEAFCPTAKGTPRWWEVSVSPLRDEGGQLQGIVSVSRDVTDRIAGRELRETAAAEMRHRLQNAYTLAGAIVASSARGTPAHEAFAGDVLTRLEQLGAAQALLLDGPAGTVALDALLRKLTDPFAGNGCTLDFGAIPGVELGEEDVRVVALAVGELSTNSNKYGALRHGGDIAIRAALDGRTLQLHWSERSRGPAPDQAGGTGSGHRLIERALKARGGGLRLDWRADGPDAVVTLPLG